MKTRLGFVSNSSSSSFVIAGIPFEYDLETDEFLSALKPEVATEYSENYYPRDPYGFFDAHGLVVRSDEYSTYYFGLPLEDMGDDETKKQFFLRAAKQLSTIFKDINPGEIAFICETDYDG